MRCALLNDLFQRVITLNKWEQRKNLCKNLKAISLKPGSRCLDFGCGTALFAPVFFSLNMKYYGYDIDASLVQYSTRIYRKAEFTSSLENLKAAGPFDMILANCCFHHIMSESLDIELAGLKNLIADDGTFMVIDILLPRVDGHWLRNKFRELERGAFIRTRADYEELVKRHFDILRSKVERSHLFSLKKIPIYNDLLILTCRKQHV